MDRASSASSGATVELLAEGRAGQPASDDEDPSVVLGGVDDAEQARVLHSCGALCGLPYRFGVGVPGVEEEHANRRSRTMSRPRQRVRPRPRATSESRS